MRYFIVAGEASGDLHGSNLIKELLSADRDAEIVCWGGDLMESAGAKLLMHYRNTAFMGFLVILKNLKAVFHNISLCKKQVGEYSPDVLILIDYPAFNLRIAKFAKESGIKVFYYISPKFWAWREKRVMKIKKWVDRMFIIFPFETGFYSKYGIPVEYMGNPLVDEIDRRISSMPGRSEILEMLQLENRPVIGILPGSRKDEIKSILPQIIRIVRDFPKFQFVIAGVKNIPDELYLSIAGDANIKIVTDKTYELLKVSEAALVKSGTSTLEAALFNTPQVVCYKGDFFSMLIARMLIRVKYISLVNLIAGSEVVKELLGYSLNRNNLVKELSLIIKGGQKREKMLSDYKILMEKLGPAGASRRIAKAMVNALRVGDKVSGR
jgi:lipid-A-disaccharide synthase